MTGWFTIIAEWQSHVTNVKLLSSIAVDVQSSIGRAVCTFIAGNLHTAVATLVGIDYANGHSYLRCTRRMQARGPTYR